MRNFLIVTFIVGVIAPVGAPISAEPVRSDGIGVREKLAPSSDRESDKIASFEKKFANANSNQSKMEILGESFSDDELWGEQLKEMIDREPLAVTKLSLIYFYWKNVTRKDPPLMGRAIYFARSENSKIHLSTIEDMLNKLTAWMDVGQLDSEKALREPKGISLRVVNYGAESLFLSSTEDDLFEGIQVFRNGKWLTVPHERSDSAQIVEIQPKTGKTYFIILPDDLRAGENIRFEKNLYSSRRLGEGRPPIYYLYSRELIVNADGAGAK